MNNFTNKWHHVAIAYKNKQMKIYLDQNRLYVIPEVKRSGINNSEYGLAVNAWSPISALLKVAA